jgi:hypothetical protein
MSPFCSLISEDSVALWLGIVRRLFDHNTAIASFLGLGHYMKDLPSLLAQVAPHLCRHAHDSPEAFRIY